jgi:hypothetical protein
MDSIEALFKAQREAAEILETAGLADGDAGEAGEVQYWNTAVKLKNASERQTYVVWNVIEVGLRSFADDKTKAQEAVVAVDIYTRQHPLANQTRDLTRAIQAAAISRGWRLEFGGPAHYDHDTALTQTLYNIRKTFK